MSTSSLSVLFESRRKPLAVGLAAAFALSAPSAIAATTWTVNTCADVNSGNPLTQTGALRWALNNASTGDVVDMTGIGTNGGIVSCSKISLLTGALAITQPKLTLNGPGANKLDIDAAALNPKGRVINHSGTGGTLYINDLSVSSGYVASGSGFVYGGCLYSKGSINLSRSSVYSCTAMATGINSARGGGVFASRDMTLYASSLHDNSASALSGGAAQGGAASTTALGNFLASYTTFRQNHVTATAPNSTLGGALFLRNGGVITHSTISGNTSDGDNGGFRAQKGNSVSTFQLLNSTVSGNSAARYYSGGGVYNAITTVANSTIAFNHSANTKSTTPLNAGLVVRQPNGSPYGITLQSSLFSNNTFGASEDDFVIIGNTATSANNLIFAAYQNTYPPGTISGVCPRLGPLRNNGGPTQTHALLSGSAGIDQGNNSLNFSTDQRGPPFARVSGVQADIGAYEIDQADIVFNNGFDGGCP